MKPLATLAAGIAISAATLGVAATAHAGGRPTTAAVAAVRQRVRRAIAPTLT